MKQGHQGSKVFEPKVEPKAKAVSVDYVANLGLRQIRTVSSELYKGRGYEAPKTADTSHPRGSQGKH
jgi:hypothetical protein